MRSIASVLCAAALCALVAPAYCGTYYVSTSGSDSIGDGSSGKPFATIQKGVWAANATAGTSAVDTLYVLPGNYAGFWNETSSTTGALPVRHINVCSYDPATGSVGVNWQNTKITGPGVNGSPWVGVRSDTTYYTYGYTLSGFAVVNTGRSGTGVASFAGANGAQGVANSVPTVVNCVITGFQYGVKLDRRGFILDNSLVYDNSYGVYLEATQPNEKKIVNSTITGNGVGVFSMYGRPVDAYNSILWGNSTADYQTQSLTSSDTVKLYYCDVGTKVNLGGGPTWDTVGCLNVNPSFMGGTGADQYRLNTASPVADKGSNTYKTTQHNDLWGNGRIQNAVIDMGAYEVASANNPPVLDVQAPAEGQKFDYNMTGVVLEADAWDGDGVVTRVEFWADGTLLNTDTVKPYKYVWANPAVGNHTVTVKAYDNAGLVTSKDVHFSVTAISIAFSDDERFITVSYKNGNFNLRRPVISPWKYTLPSGSHCYYVATNGKDSNAGTEASPFATIQHASDISVAGDIIYIKPGTYVQTVNVTRSGSVGKPIIYSCAPGALGSVVMAPPSNYIQPMTDPSFDSQCNPMFAIRNSAQYIYINGLVIQGPTQWSDLQGATPKWKSIYGGCGIGFANGGGPNCKATNNVCFYNIHCGFKEMGHGGNGIFFEGNISFENGRVALDHGIYLPSNNHVVNGCIFFRNAGYGIHCYSNPQNLTITRNISFGHPNGAGIILQSTNCLAYNNVVTDNSVGIQSSNSGNSLQNNIAIYNNANFNRSGTNTDSNNCFYPAGPSPLGTGSIQADPQFLNRINLTAGTGGDYLIAKASPCVNAGVNVGLPYSGSAPDMGAFEADQPVVMGRYIFYNNSRFDGNDPAANAADDGAIAPDKSPLFPNHTAAFKNYTSYSRGINGIMVDIANLPAGTPTAADFTFKVGNDNNPAAWAAAPNPGSITVRRGAGVCGSDRVTIIWPDGAIQKQWLQVTVKGNTHTGLPADDVFYWGNAVGETGNSTTDAMVTPADEIGCRNNPHTLLNNPAAITDPYDFNRDGKVGPSDEIIARNNATNSTTAIKLITAP